MRLGKCHGGTEPGFINSRFYKNSWNLKKKSLGGRRDRVLVTFPAFDWPDFQDSRIFGTLRNWPCDQDPGQETLHSARPATELSQHAVKTAAIVARPKWQPPVSRSWFTLSVDTLTRGDDTGDLAYLVVTSGATEQMASIERGLIQKKWRRRIPMQKLYGGWLNHRQMFDSFTDDCQDTAPSKNNWTAASKPDAVMGRGKHNSHKCDLGSLGLFRVLKHYNKSISCFSLKKDFGTEAHQHTFATVPSYLWTLRGRSHPMHCSRVRYPISVHYRLVLTTL